MRVLFSSTSGAGHVIPMLQLARAFLDTGHEVLWALSEDATALVTAAGVDAAPSGAHGEEEKRLRGAVFTGARDLPGDQRAPYVFPRMFGEALTPPMLVDLLPLAERWRPDLVVHEQGELAAPLVAAVLGVPSVTHSFGTAVPAEILDDTTQRLAGLWRTHGLTVPEYAGCFAAGYLDICPPSVQSTSVAHIDDVRPLRPVTTAVRSLRTQHEPRAYVTMGTVQNQPELLRQIVTGVGALLVPVLVAVGRQVDPAVLGELPAHVRVEPWVDQAAELARSSLVVSHGGSGTFLHALALGLPQLVLPQAADQFRNAEGGERAGAALVLRPGEVSADTVAAATERLLEEPAISVAAQDVAREIGTMPSPAEVAADLAELAGPGPT